MRHVALIILVIVSLKTGVTMSRYEGFKFCTTARVNMPNHVSIRSNCGSGWERFFGNVSPCNKPAGCLLPPALILSVVQVMLKLCTQLRRDRSACCPFARYRSWRRIVQVRISVWMPGAWLRCLWPLVCANLRIARKHAALLRL